MIFQKIRQQSPIVHCITNIVSANFQANGLLAIGASPIMADFNQEMEEMLSKVSALSLNIGTLDDAVIETMLIAGRYANQYGKPIVLDPVGAGFTEYRTKMALKLLEELDISLIRCNSGELASLAGIEWHSKGVDSGRGNIELIKEKIQEIAQKYSCCIAMTGAEDLLASASEMVSIPGGTELITYVTASGCLLSSICASSLCVDGENYFSNIQETLKWYKKAALVAESKSREIGSFKVEFINTLYNISLGVI